MASMYFWKVSGLDRPIAPGSRSVFSGMAERPFSKSCVLRDQQQQQKISTVPRFFAVVVNFFRRWTPPHTPELTGILPSQFPFYGWTDCTHGRYCFCERKKKNPASEVQQRTKHCPNTTRHKLGKKWWAKPIPGIQNSIQNMKHEIWLVLLVLQWFSKLFLIGFLRRFRLPIIRWSPQSEVTLLWTNQKAKAQPGLSDHSSQPITRRELSLGLAIIHHNQSEGESSAWAQEFLAIIHHGFVPAMATMSRTLVNGEYIWRPKALKAPWPPWWRS